MKPEIKPSVFVSNEDLECILYEFTSVRPISKSFLWFFGGTNDDGTFLKKDVAHKAYTHNPEKHGVFCICSREKDGDIVCSIDLRTFMAGLSSYSGQMIVFEEDGTVKGEDARDAGLPYKGEIRILYDGIPKFDLDDFSYEDTLGVIKNCIEICKRTNDYKDL